MSDSEPRPDPDRLLRDAEQKGPPQLDEAERQALQDAFPELRIEGLIGRGGMASVYRAVQPKLSRTVALKVMNQELAKAPEFVQRFEREARALAQLDHPRILRVIEFGERDGRCYLLTDHVDGVDMRKLMELGQLSPEEALRIVPQLCEALRYAHMRGVVHRDVKPENILIDLDGNVRIADFGLTRILQDPDDAAALTRTSQILGTPHYMAPEQWRSGQVDHRADIYALGVVLYEMLTGKLPLGDFPPPSSSEGVPPRLDAIVRRALAQDPERRFQQVEEMESALQDEGADAGDGSDAATDAANATSRARTRSISRWTIAALSTAAVSLPYLAIAAALWVDPSTHLHESPLPALGVAALLQVAAGAFGYVGQRATARSGRTDGLSLAAFATWIGPTILFDTAIMVPLLTSESLQSSEWVYALAIAALAPMNFWFLRWQIREALAAQKAA